MTASGIPSAITTSASEGRVLDRTHLDWITVTHADVEVLREFLRGPVKRRTKGLNVYQRAMNDGHGAVLAWGGPEPRPAMLVMTGTALAAWRTDLTDRDLVEELAHVSAHCTRLDLSRDTSGPWTPYRLREFIEADRYVSRWHGFTYRCAKGGTALTVYCGSRQSEVMMRAYDKRAEMQEKGEPCPYERLSRWEFEIKGKRAPLAFAQLARLRAEVDPLTGEEVWPVRSIHSRWLGLQLRLTVDPVDKDNNNHARAVTDPEWERFVSTVHEGDLGIPADERTPQRVAFEVGRWAASTIAPAVAFIGELGGEEALQDLVSDGVGRMNARHRMLLERREEAREALLAGLRARAAQNT